MEKDYNSLVKEFESKTYLGKAVAIVKSFHKGDITGDESDRLASYFGIDPKDLITIFKFGYENSKDIFRQPNILLSQINLENATKLDKIVLLALELKRNNINHEELERYSQVAKVEIKDVESIYDKLEIEIEKQKRHNHEAIKVNKGIEVEELEYTYTALHKHISNLFIYTSPALSLALFYKEADKLVIDNEELDDFINYVSNAGKTEEKISNAEKGYAELFIATTSSTRAELSEILGSDLSKAFYYDEGIPQGIFNTLKKSRIIIENEVKGIIIRGQQVGHFIKEADLNIGGLGMELIKGAGLGHMAAVALGPVGVLAAMGSLYLKGQKESKETQEQFLNTLSEFEKAYSSLLDDKLPLYYKKCYELSDNLAKQYIVNFKLVENISREQNKLKAYNDYLQKQLVFFVNDEGQKNIREKLKVIENSILQKEA